MNDLVHKPDVTAELRGLLSAFTAEVMRYDTADMLRILQREELSMPRIAALNFVEQRRAASISEIRAYLQLSLANTSIVVDKLVCSGFVTRVEDANDRRHKVVRLTGKGRALVDELRTARVDSAAQRMALLPPELLARLLDVLGDVTAHLATMRPQHESERPNVDE